MLRSWCPEPPIDKYRKKIILFQQYLVHKRSVGCRANAGEGFKRIAQGRSMDLGAQSPARSSEGLTPRLFLASAACW
jgi:hypothetical protein